MICTQCGTSSSGAKFCPECGAALVVAEQRVAEERKVVSVLFCDLVGFTRRSEAMDVEDVRGTLAPYHRLLRGVIEGYGGTVEKFIGDAVMALFGAPVAHEDDAERAVRSALAIVDAVAGLRHEDPRLDLRVRVGVNTGEALIALSADPARGEGMASGDVVNTAARLESAAPVDGVLVGEVTFRATDRAIVYEMVDPVAAKGKAEPVAAWRALEARSRFGTDVVQESGTPLVGRDGEVAGLRTVLERAIDRRTVQLVTLVGVPGIGKSRLVWELFKMVDARSDLVTWRQGRCLPYGDGVTFWALGEMVKAQAGILDSDGTEVAAEKLRAMLDVTILDLGERDWVWRHACLLVGVEGGQAAAADGRVEAAAAWRRLVESLAASRPLVLVFEDLHWADDALLDFVDYLAEWASDVPLLIVCTARPELLERRRGWGGGKPNAATIALEALSDSDTARLLAALFDRAVIPADTQRALLDRAQGNPLYAEEYVRMLVDRGLLDQAADAPLPESVQGIIAARLDALSVDEKALLQDAAVVGKVAWLGAVCALGELSRHQAEEPLHRLVRKEFLRRAQRSSVEGDVEYVFRHALVRDVAYQQIPRALRAAKHERAAAWIEQLAGDRDETVEMRAHHYRHALEYAQAAGTTTPQLIDNTRSALGEAADRALNLGAVGSAVSLYESALELSGSPDTAARPMLLYGYCQALDFAGRPDPDLYATAVTELSAGGEPAAAATIEVLRAYWYADAADAQSAQEAFERAVHLADGTEPNPAKARALAGAATGFALMGEPERALVLGREALAIAESTEDAYAATRALMSIALALPYGDPESITLLERAADTARAADLPILTIVLLNLCGRLEADGRVRKASCLLPEVAESARKFGNRLHDMASQIVGFSSAVHLGGWRDAEAGVSDLLRNHDLSAWDRAQVLSTRGQLRVALGMIEVALTDAEEVLDFARVSSEPQQMDFALVLSAQCHAELGSTEAASRLIKEWCELEHRDGYSEAIVWAATAMHLVGQQVQFASLLPPRFPTPWYDTAVSITCCQHDQAADVLLRIGSLANEAQSRLMAARHLISLARHTDAAPHIARAIHIYEAEHATERLREAQQLRAAAATG